ncbi:MAG: hypothetical protein JNN05_04430, partial [Candidatus Omnitrophica bacterium]|nr:hypothetical protein [Candidatus Omnitrophota bacterium]
GFGWKVVYAPTSLFGESTIALVSRLLNLKNEEAFKDIFARAMQDGQLVIMESNQARFIYYPLDETGYVLKITIKYADQNSARTFRYNAQGSMVNAYVLTRLKFEQEMGGTVDRDHPSQASSSVSELFAQTVTAVVSAAQAAKDFIAILSAKQWVYSDYFSVFILAFTALALGGWVSVVVHEMWTDNKKKWDAKIKAKLTVERPRLSFKVEYILPPTIPRKPGLAAYLERKYSAEKDVQLLQSKEPRDAVGFDWRLEWALYQYPHLILEAIADIHGSKVLFEHKLAEHVAVWKKTNHRSINPRRFIPRWLLAFFFSIRPWIPRTIASGLFTIADRTVALFSMGLLFKSKNVDRVLVKKLYEDSFKKVYQVGITTVFGESLDEYPVVMKVTNSSNYGQVKLVEAYKTDVIEAANQLHNNDLYPRMGSITPIRNPLGDYWLIAEGHLQGNNLEQNRDRLLSRKRNNELTPDRINEMLFFTERRAIEVFLKIWLIWRENLAIENEKGSRFIRNPYLRSIIHNQVVIPLLLESDINAGRLVDILWNMELMTPYAQRARLIGQAAVHVLGGKQAREFLEAVIIQLEKKRKSSQYFLDHHLNDGSEESRQSVYAFMVQSLATFIKHELIFEDMVHLLEKMRLIPESDRDNRVNLLRKYFVRSIQGISQETISHLRKHVRPLRSLYERYYRTAGKIEFALRNESEFRNESVPGLPVTMQETWNGILDMFLIASVNDSRETIPIEFIEKVSRRDGNDPASSCVENPHARKNALQLIEQIKTLVLKKEYKSLEDLTKNGV